MARAMPVARLFASEAFGRSTPRRPYVGLAVASHSDHVLAELTGIGLGHVEHLQRHLPLPPIRCHRIIQQSRGSPAIEQAVVSGVKAPLAFGAVVAFLAAGLSLLIFQVGPRGSRQNNGTGRTISTWSEPNQAMAESVITLWRETRVHSG